jgi:hypothetical protein
MDTLIIFPTELIKSYYSKRSDIFFLDQFGIYFSDGAGKSKKIYKLFSDTEINLDLLSEYQSILGKINWWMPVWYRWVANADQYDLLTRDATFFVLQVISTIRNLDISTAIFHTGIAHHVDSSLIEIALVVTKIKQVYLYANSINGRLLPLKQDYSIADRKPQSITLSSYASTKDISNYIKNKELRGKPIINEGINYDQSYFGAISKTIYSSFRKHAVLNLRKLAGQNKAPFPVQGASELSTSDHLRLIREQKKAIFYYLSKVVNDPSLLNCWSGEAKPIPLIAAHFQPEATSFPEGGEFSNHIDIVVKLRQHGYQGMILYKEHPGSFMYHSRVVGATRVGMSRSVNYYKKLLALGCVFLSPDFNLSVIPQDSFWFVPVTITGSVAIERSLFGLSTIVAGHPWYSGLPGVVDFSNTDDLENVLNVTRTKSLEIEEASFAYLDTILSYKTIVNIAGIGTGISCDDESSISTFFKEFDVLLASLGDSYNIL